MQIEMMTYTMLCQYVFYLERAIDFDKQLYNSHQMKCVYLLSPLKQFLNR